MRQTQWFSFRMYEVWVRKKKETQHDTLKYQAPLCQKRIGKRLTNIIGAARTWEKLARTKGAREIF